jgi:membrane-anchored protein YejM (alkaline phosphatase superfamily)
MTKRRTRRIIRFSGHARQQCLARGILEKDVVSILQAPMGTVYDEYEENYKSFGNGTDAYTKKTQLLLVVHTDLKEKSGVTVITVMWTSTARLRGYGFSNV